MLRTSLIFEFGHALEDEWPCKGPDVKGRARPGPNILKTPQKDIRVRRRAEIVGAFCASLRLLLYR